MTRVFLSYARGDDFDPADPGRAVDRERFDPGRSWVARLHRDLAARGFEVWFDRVSMPSRGLTFHQEIRDAVQACDRLVLVVGPHAAESDYVRQEWQFAWFAAEKIVTPILLRGRAPLAPHVDDIKLLPDELKLLHCEDFRDEAQYAFHLNKLVDSLRAPAPPLGKLIGVPSLPAHFLSRTDRLIPLREAVRSGLDSPAPLGGVAIAPQLHGISATKQYVGAYGMGGIGKSVLANLLVRDRKVREAFPDGIVWIGLGQEPKLTELLRRVHRDLGGDGDFDDLHAGRQKLKDLLKDKAALLVIDDAWERGHVEAFDALGPRCRAVITTRDAGLVTKLGGTHHPVELLTDDESLRLLAGLVNREVAALPPEAKLALGECGRLPLAVALVGGMVESGMPWPVLLSAFKSHRLEFFADEHSREPQHGSLWKAIEVSVRALPEPEQERLIELAAFAEDESTPDGAIATLWEHTGELEDFESAGLLLKLKRRSLVQVFAEQAIGSASLGAIRLHDLIRDYCLRRSEKRPGGVAGLHQSLVDAYAARCDGNWPAGPDDGYFFQRLVHHLSAAGKQEQARRLVADFSWLMRKCELGLVDSITADYVLLLWQGPPDPELKLDIWRAFFQEKAHILRRGGPEWPSHKILLQLAMEHADDSPLTLAAEAWLAEGRCDWFWLRNMRRLPRAEKNPCLAVLEGHESAVNGAQLLPDGRILSWSGDHTLRLWDGGTGKPLDNLEGHTGGVDGAQLLADGRILSWASFSVDKTPHLWDGVTGKPLAILEGHTDVIFGVLLLPDDRILSWSGDLTLRLWDGLTGEPLAKLEGHTDEIKGVLLLPNGLILSWSKEETLRLWDGVGGKPLAILKGHIDEIKGVQLLPDGRILTWSKDETLRLWDGVSGKPLAVMIGHSDEIMDAQWLHDGRILSWTSKTLRLWDGESGGHLSILRGSTRFVNRAQSLPDGRFLTWFGATLHLWNDLSGKPLAILEGHTESVFGTLSLPDGRILTWSGDATLRLWDGVSGKPLAILEGHTDSIKGVLLRPDGRILSWSFDKTLRLWDGVSGKPLAILEGHTDSIKGVQLLPDGRILSWSTDKTLRLWDGLSGKPQSILKEHRGPIYGIQSLPDGRILTWSKDKTLRLWDGVSGTPLAILEGHTDLIRGVQSLPDSRILSWSDDSTLRLWNGVTGEPLACLEGHTYWVNGAQLLPDGRILSWSFDNTLRLWDGLSGKPLAVLKGHRATVDDAQLLPDGRILSWSTDKTLRLWDGVSGKPLAILGGHTDWICGVEFFPDGRILSWSGDKTLRLWDGVSGKPLAILEGHTGWVHGAKLLSDGRILSWSGDKTLRLWDAVGGKPLAILEGHMNSVYGAELLPDGRILSWSGDQTLRLWDGESGKPLEVIDEYNVVRLLPNWFATYVEKRYDKFASGVCFIKSTDRMIQLFGCHCDKPVVRWESEGGFEAQQLRPDGTVIATQHNGQLCILKLHHGARPISLAEAEALSATSRKQRGDGRA